LFKLKNKKFKNEIHFLKGSIFNRNIKIFGVSSQQVDVNQFSLFNEAERFSNSKMERLHIKQLKKLHIYD